MTEAILQLRLPVRGQKVGRGDGRGPAVAEEAVDQHPPCAAQPCTHVDLGMLLSPGCRESVLKQVRHAVAPDETVILLHPPLPLVGVSMVMERGCQQNDSLVNGYHAGASAHRRGHAARRR